MSPGLNFVWYVDGHDGPYDFSIHRCIDGLSWRMLWLKVSPSNKMSEALAKHHLDAVKQYVMPVNIKVADRTEHI